MDNVAAFLDLPWPVVAVVTTLGLGLIGIGLAGLIAFGVWVITRVPPFAWVLSRSLRGMIEPLEKHAERRVREIVSEEVEPIRRQVFPNDGGSMRDQIDDLVRLSTVRDDESARMKRQIDGLVNKYQDVEDAVLRLQAQRSPVDEPAEG